MILWIRSQNKDILIKCNSIELDDHSTYCEIWVNGFDKLIGNYKSEKRALEVLDEIQKIIKWCQDDFDDYVYEMPLE